MSSRDTINAMAEYIAGELLAGRAPYREELAKRWPGATLEEIASAVYWAQKLEFSPDEEEAIIAGAEAEPSKVLTIFAQWLEALEAEAAAPTEAGADAVHKREAELREALELEQAETAEELACKGAVACVLLAGREDAGAQALASLYLDLSELAGRDPFTEAKDAMARGIAKREGGADVLS